MNTLVIGGTLAPFMRVQFEFNKVDLTKLVLYCTKPIYRFYFYYQKLQLKASFGTPNITGLYRSVHITTSIRYLFTVEGRYSKKYCHRIIDI